MALIVWVAPLAAAMAGRSSLWPTRMTVARGGAPRPGGRGRRPRRLLEMLARHHPEPLEPHELARALAMGSNHVTMVLDQLQARGLVDRQPHPHDRRRPLVVHETRARPGP